MPRKIIRNGRIAAIGLVLDGGPDAQVIDARGLMVLPGGVDCHTHMDNTFGASTTCDSFESGTRSAAFGGATTIVDFAFQRKDVSVLEAIERTRAKGAAGACIDYGFHVVVTGMNDQALADMRHAIRHEGISSFKMFMAYPGSVMVDDAAIFQAMRMVGKAMPFTAVRSRLMPPPPPGHGARPTESSVPLRAMAGLCV